MRSKISEYLGSQEFLNAATVKTKAAVADAVAKGLVPACDPTPELPDPPEVVVIPKVKSGNVSAAE